MHSNSKNSDDQKSVKLTSVALPSVVLPCATLPSVTSRAPEELDDDFLEESDCRKNSPLNKPVENFMNESNKESSNHVKNRNLKLDK